MARILENKIAISKMIIVLTLVVVVAIGGIGAYVLLSQNGSTTPDTSLPTNDPNNSVESTATATPFNQNSATPTSTTPGTTQPTATSTSPTSTEPITTATPTNMNSPTPNTSTPSETTQPSTVPKLEVGQASSLKYTVSLTENGVLQGAYTFSGKNIGTDSFMMRIDYTSPDGDGSYIFNGAQQKAWIYSDNEWTDISSMYTAQFPIWSDMWHGYVNNLAAWTGIGDYSYSSDGSTVRIYDISVNPILADSLFVHS